MPKNDRILDGYYFRTTEEYEAALKEKQVVTYLTKQIDMNSAEQVLRLYQQAISQQLFSTVIGISFLKELQNALLKSPEIPKEHIVPVSINLPAAGKESSQETPEVRKEKGRREKVSASRERPERRERSSSGKKYRQKFHAAVAVILILVATVIAMFVILLTSDSPTVLNYKQSMNDYYSKWESDLTERENAVEARENALNETIQEAQKQLNTRAGNDNE